MSTGPIVAALYGVWRLANLDRSGLDCIDRSPEGAVRSFWAAGFLAAPFLLLLILRQSDGVDPFRYYSVHALSYVIGWTLFPLAMIHVVRLLDRRHLYFNFIATYNWSAMIQNGLHFTVAFIAESRLLGPGPLTLLGLATLILALGYAWYVTRIALDLPAGAAGAVVALDVLFGVLVDRVAARII